LIPEVIGAIIGKASLQRSKKKGKLGKLNFQSTLAGTEEMDVYAVRWGVLNLFGFTIGSIHITGQSRERLQAEAPSSQGVPRYDAMGETEGKIPIWERPPISQGQELPSHLFLGGHDPLSLLLPKLDDSVGLIIDLRV